MEISLRTWRNSSRWYNLSSYCTFRLLGLLRALREYWLENLGIFLFFSIPLLSFLFFVVFLKVLTKDSVTVSVDAVVYYRVSNATVSIANVENAHHSTRLLAQTTLRNTMGTQHLHEILSERMTISDTMQVSSLRTTNHKLQIPNHESRISDPLLRIIWR